MSYRVLGYGYTWWHGDPLPCLPSLAGLRMLPTTDAALIAGLAQLSQAEVTERMRQANQAYVAYMETEPAAYGWSAAQTGAIYELGFNFKIPSGNRYLWDFATLPAWRGRGIYPRLLQAILASEGSAADRFWIGHTGENEASQRGIIKAGFQLVEALVIVPGATLAILPFDPRARAEVSPMGLSLDMLALDRDTTA
jgi:GNAT superfamily N-acetyltransferase